MPNNKEVLEAGTRLIDLNELSSDDEFALHLSDTMKQGCENAGLGVEINPSVGGYHMTIYTQEADLCVDVFISPTGHINTLN